MLVEIDSLQNYYGKAIRTIVPNVNAMADAIWAIYYSRISTDDQPCHHLCPTGPKSWCNYNKAKALDIEYKHDHSILEAVMKVIKPVFMDLTEEELLLRCTHGKTQNPNESYNSTT